MPEAPLGVGLIGCGDVAPRHASAVAEADGVRLVACMDVLEGPATSLSEAFGVPYTTSVEALVGRDDVDLVVIASPPFTHLELTQKAAAAGKAILCEKPLALSLAEADRMIAACQEAAVALATCFPMRYLRAAGQAEQLVRSGALGEVIGIRIHNLSEKKDCYWTGGYSGRTKTDWRTSRRASGGGVVMTNISHHLDLVRSITGLEVARVYAEAGTFCTEVEVEDLAVASLRYENGAIGTIEGCSCFFGGAQEWDIVLLGTKGQFRLGIWSHTSEVFLTEPTDDLPAREWIRQDHGDAQQVELYQDLAAALRNGSPPPIAGEDGRASLEIVLAIYQSAESGEPITLSH